MRCRNSSGTIYKDVVIVGNGPSGIALSYMLSGNLPYVTSDSHPDEMLSIRLESALNKCLIDQDLNYLSSGLEGRSTNSVSLLLDALLHPHADVGLEIEPLVEFRKTGKEIDHVVLGKGPPGGSWHKMDPNILTLSLANWMTLPGLPFPAENAKIKRALAKNVASYYENYTKEMHLSKYFIVNTIVTRVMQLNCNKSAQDTFVGKLNDNSIIKENNSFCLQQDDLRSNNRKSCAISNAINYVFSGVNRKLKSSKYWKRQSASDRKIREIDKINDNDSIVSIKENRRSINNCNNERCISFSCDNNFYNHQSTNDDSDDFLKRKNSDSIESSPSNVSLRSNNKNCDASNPTDKQCCWLVETYNTESGEKTTYSCKYLVLANGTSDSPNKLEISKNKRDPEWLFHDLPSLENYLDETILANQSDRKPVLVVGAGLSAADAVIAARGRQMPVVHVFRNKSSDMNRQLPENMYPEYNEVHKMMKNESSDPAYVAYPEYTLSNIEEEPKTIFLTSKTGETTQLQVSCAVILIGSKPNLNFFNSGVRKLPIDDKSSTIKINKLTHAVDNFDNLFCLGPLAGDNFVRFIPGGALAVVSEMCRRGFNN